MKIIHLADLHLGVDTHGPIDPETRLNGRVIDFLESFDAAIDFAYEENIDLAVIAGDSYHKPSPDPTLQREFGERIIRLSEQCPVVILVGNHDMPNSIEKASAVDVFSVLRVSNVIVGYDYDVRVIETKSGKIQVATFPYPLKQRFLEPGEIKDPESDRIFKERLLEMVFELESKINNKYPSIFLGHFTVDNAKLGSEQSMSFGAAAEFITEDLVSDKWDYVALGHIHYHQCLNESPPVVYAGSLDRVDFSEEKDDKGFVLITIDENGTQWEQILIDARPFITINMELVEHPTASVISNIKKMYLLDAVVRLILTMEEHVASSFHQQKVVKALEDVGVYSIYSIRLNIIKKDRGRLELEEGETASSIPPIELLDMFFHTEGFDDDRIEELLETADTILDDSQWIAKGDKQKFIGEE